MYDVYIRVSRLGDRTEDEATEVYEAQCREWAARNGVTVDEVVEDTDVKGSIPVAERGLERLVLRVEAGDSEGIITPYIDRFGRDMIEGALAYTRIKNAGGRLVCVGDGADSGRDGNELIFNIRLAIAQDYLSRTRSNFKGARDLKVERGAHVHQVKPGYRRGDDGKLHVYEPEAKVIRKLFELRAAGETWASLWRLARERGIVNRYTGKPYTKNGIKTLVSSRTYLGEVSVPSDRPGHPRVLKNQHPPLVSVQQWEAANAVQGAFFPRGRKLSLQAKLRGMVWCEGGHRMKVAGYGPPESRKAAYACTAPDCASRATIRATKLDAHVDRLLVEAATAREPHVAAIIEGNVAWQGALAEVQEAQRLHDELRDDPRAQAELGLQDWMAALRVRKEAVTVARQQLARVRPANGANGNGTAPSFEEFLERHEREVTAQFIDRVVVKPSPPGVREVEASERVDVYLVGATEPYRSAV